MEGRYTSPSGDVYFVSGGKLLTEKWKKVDGKWYYAKNGRFLYQEIAVIKGTVYFFSFDGTLMKNRAVIDYRIYDSYYDPYFGEDGTLATTEGWKTDADGYKYYTDANGRPLRGIRKIGGKAFYFDYDGRLLP